MLCKVKINTKKAHPTGSFFCVRRDKFWYLRDAKSSNDFVIGRNVGTVKYEISVLEYAFSRTNAVKQKAPIMILKDRCLNSDQLPKHIYTSHLLN